MKLLTFLHRWRHMATLNNAALVLALLVTLGWLWGTVTSLQRNFALQQQVDALDQDIDLLKIENESLKYQGKYYSSDEYIELSARARLNKAAAGEKLVILPPQPKVEHSQPGSLKTSAPDTSNFEQWVRFFFGRRA